MEVCGNGQRPGIFSIGEVNEWCRRSSASQWRYVRSDLCVQPQCAVGYPRDPRSFTGNIVYEMSIFFKKYRSR